jgi:hypothetical protein
MLRAAIEKHPALVQKLWTTILPCGTLRKSALESRHKEMSTSAFNNLDAVKKITAELNYEEKAPSTGRSNVPLAKSRRVVVNSGPRGYIDAQIDVANHGWGAWRIGRAHCSTNVGLGYQRDSSGAFFYGQRRRRCAAAREMSASTLQ